jgi:hypothetical protein
MEDDDIDIPERPRGKLSAFLYDLGWVNTDPEWATKRVPLGEDPPAASAELSKPRNKLSQFMYDLGWLQSIDWDSPKTLQYVKRGSIGLAVLLAAFIMWPSHKAPRLNAAQAALVAQAEKENVQANPAPKAKPIMVAQPTPKARISKR